MPDIDTEDLAAVQRYVASLSPLLQGTAGGNTSCVEVRSDGTTLIIDAGTGLRELGRVLMQGPCGVGEGEVYLLFSHAHWDHIQGFPFFAPAYIAGNRLHILSIHDVEHSLKQQLDEHNFPVRWEHLSATITFERLQANAPFRIEPFKLQSLRNSHPGDAYSYRIEHNNNIFVYAHDSEYAAMSPAERDAHINHFCRADVLLFDAQYSFRDTWSLDAWGHSSARMGVDLARAAGVQRLILSHHDPTSTDRELEEIANDAYAYQAQTDTLPTCEIQIAYDGLEFELK